MKKIGVIGGLSPELTCLYYKWLNEGIQRKLGGGHSAKILLASGTEITLLITQEESFLPVFDTTQIHVEAAFDAVF